MAQGRAWIRHHGQVMDQRTQEKWSVVNSGWSASVQATGPLNQATGPPQSDAGVGIGMLRGAGDSLTWKKKSWFDLPHFRSMFFDRNEIHIQAFEDFINGKSMSGQSSSSTFHYFHEFIISNYQEIRNSEFQKFKKWLLGFSEFRKNRQFQFSDFHR